MPRPPPTTPERMLRAGTGIARRSGLAAVTVRAVVLRAGANPGSFVYHFGTRDAYLEALIERWYAPLLPQLRAAGAAAAPLPRLRAALLQMATWLRANRTFLWHLLLAAAGGEPAARRFMRSLAARHPALLLQRVVDAQRAGALATGDPLEHLLLLASAVGLPVLLAPHLAALGLAPALARPMARLAAAPDALERRLDRVLVALAPSGGKRRAK